MKRNVVWAAITVVVFLCGLLLGSSGSADSEAPRGERTSNVVESSRVPTRHPEGASEREAESTSPPSARDAVGRAWSNTVGREPTEAEWDRIRRAAEQARAQLREQAERAEFVQALRLAREFVEEQKRLEDAERGGTMQMLRGLSQSPTRMPRLVADRDAFAALFERKAQGPRLNGTALPPSGEEIPDGATLEFPAGVHSLDTRRAFGRGGRFPKDLLIVGVGMDETLVRIDEVSTRDEVSSLTFRDLTLDCNGNYMTDFRAESPATIRLERCRVVGFDMGAGGSVMFAAETGAFYATDCRFEAGYSRTPAGSGNLFRVRSGLLVRMENCQFLGPFRSIFDSNSGATFQFDRCEIQDTRRFLSGLKTDSRKGVVFQDCTLVELSGDTRSILRSFSDLNPVWPKRKR